MGLLRRELIKYSKKELYFYYLAWIRLNETHDSITIKRFRFIRRKKNLKY